MVLILICQCKNQYYYYQFLLVFIITVVGLSPRCVPYSLCIFIYSSDTSRSFFPQIGVGLKLRRLDKVRLRDSSDLVRHYLRVPHYIEPVFRVRTPSCLISMEVYFSPVIRPITYQASHLLRRSSPTLNQLSCSSPSLVGLQPFASIFLS